MGRMRWLLLVVTGCGFSANAPPPSDGTPGDGTPDAADTDGASVDAATIDAAMPDAPMPAVIVFKQGASDVSGGAVVATLSLTQSIALGDLCVVGIATMGTVVTVTDSAGNPYARLGTSGGLSVWVAANMRASGADAITVAFAGNSGYTAAAAVYSGLALASPLDAMIATSGQGTTLSTGTITTSHPHDLIVGIVGSNGSLVAGAGFTKRVGGNFSLIEDREVTSTGSYGATATAGQNSNWSMAMVALKAAD
jgi:hypothetical protein